ncbi:hypothetical protein [Comamonas sp. MYb396]|uniref:hypothetical protein n=1 Tax=Comamonas sp. MYb396 TaxID=2745302 RepID=UPI0030DAA589
MAAIFISDRMDINYTDASCQAIICCLRQCKGFSLPASACRNADWHKPRGKVAAQPGRSPAWPLPNRRDADLEVTQGGIYSRAVAMAKENNAADRLTARSDHGREFGRGSLTMGKAKQPPE